MIDLKDYYMAYEAAEVLTANSGHKISPDYVRRLVQHGVLTPLRLGGRNFYRRAEVDGYVVKGVSRKSSSAACA